MDQAEFEDQKLYRPKQECHLDANLDRTVRILLLAYLKFSAKLGWSMQTMLRLLQLNLFMRRDLMALLRGDPPERNTLNDGQLCLI